MQGGEILLSFKFCGHIIPIGEHLIEYSLSIEQAERIYVQLGVAIRDGNEYCDIEIEAPDRGAGYGAIVYRLDVAQTKAVHLALGAHLQKHYQDIQPSLQIVEQG